MIKLTKAVKPSTTPTTIATTTTANPDCPYGIDLINISFIF